MSSHIDDLSRHVRIYLLVFFALLVGTLVTVALNAVHFESMPVTICIALFVAAVKASLVACYFMHLISERKMIYLILAFTVFFFTGLMFLTLGAYHDFPPQTVTH
jgi:cytochrome c oxidase subunit 4